MDGRERTYDVCLSFAGERRGCVGQAAGAMADSQVRAFYDGSAANKWGRDPSVYFEGIYRPSPRHCMIFSPREYVAKMLPSLERAHAIARRIKDKGGCMLPVTVDGARVPGLAATVFYEDARTKSPREIAGAFVRLL